MPAAIWWIRRDLRLRDNPALEQATSGKRAVVPVFILDPALLASRSVGPKRLAFLYGGLKALDQALRHRGARLIIRTGSPVQALGRLIEECGAERVWAQEDYSPYARRRDHQVGKSLPLTLTPGVSMYHPSEVVKDDGDPYTVYTPFAKRWLSRPTPHQITPAPDRIEALDTLASDPIPEPPVPLIRLACTPGEAEALERLDAFTAGLAAPVYAYHETRNRMDLPGTSMLSPYLRFGMLSPSLAVRAAQDAMEAAPDERARKGVHTWLQELIWREFFQAILYHFPSVSQASFRPAYRDIPWANDEADFRAWCDGRTGYPVVDAAMRQLAQTGWMHNRARMIVASFLTKDLLIDWRWGERRFMQHLIDGDPAANNGGWQWTAGTGTDAAPYFRIFNPVLQGEKFDPDGRYIRRWVPELQNVPQRFIHTPWKMPLGTQKDAACVLGSDYPAPIVDHRWARERTLNAYRQARQAG